MRPGLSLANKCLLVFGGAIVLIVLAASSGPWLRMNALVDEGQLELSRHLATTWDLLDREGGGISFGWGQPVERAGITARRLTVEQAAAAAEKDSFLGSALRTLRESKDRDDIQSPRWSGTTREYRYARAVRDTKGELQGLILLERRPVQASRLLLVNTVYLLSAGSVVLGLAVLVFYVITHTLILQPVRALKETAEEVRRGNIETRSTIETGDEFQELAETFNVLLSDMQEKQDQLRSTNAALDLKINELKEANVGLYDAARVKGEFLANISHELRTPLNSIIGFAELLLEIARGDKLSLPHGEEPTPQIAKRIRYSENIVIAGRNLLEMINDLLEMARIEAGRVELHPEKSNLRGACEALIGLIYPLAERKGITLKLECPDDVPTITTDVKKLQQIVFNFLSNAVKFTAPTEKSGRPAHVTLRVERLHGGGGSGDSERVRVSVIDTGPGIPEDERERIFEKFTQLDGTHTRGHQGTGLGLAIARDLAEFLQGEIQVVSEVGRGSMFSLILPLELDTTRTAESRLEARFRGTLAGKRAWSV